MVLNQFAILVLNLGMHYLSKSEIRQKKFVKITTENTFFEQGYRVNLAYFPLCIVYQSTLFG